MGMILYTYPYKDKSLKFKPWCPTIYPYTQSVNRVTEGLDPFNYTKLCEPISQIVSMPKNEYSFEEMCLLTADNINKTIDKKIYLYYSGGMDSAAALVSLKKVMSKSDLEKLYIVATHHSILEFPEFWNDINSQFKGRIINAYTDMESLTKDGVVLTGQMADHVLGSDNIKRVHKEHGDAGINMPWKEAMYPIYRQQFGGLLAHNFIDVYGETTKACPFPIVTAFDWVWWYGFTNKWQHAKYKFLGYKPWVNPQESYKNVIHFFDTPLWQRWSLDNHDKKIKDTMNTYKFIIKNFVAEETGYDSYFKKKKRPSLRFLWFNKDFYYGISDDFTSLSKEESLEYLNNSYNIGYFKK